MATPGASAPVRTDASVDLEALLESYVGGVVAFSPSGELLRLNRGAEEILGLQRGEVHTALELLALARPEDEGGRPIRLEDTPFGRARRGERVRETVVSIRRPYGGRRWLVASAAPVIVDGEPKAVVIGFMDVTERRQIRERNARAHAPASRSRARAEPSAATLTGELMYVLQQLEELQQLESGLISVKVEAVDVKASILDVLERLRGSAHARVRLDLGPATPRARADPAHLDTITASLLDAALKSTPATAEVVVACRQEAHRVVVEVRDDGSAAERQEDLDRLLAGLRLYVAQRLAEAQGGTLTVRSQGGRGIVCTVRLAAWTSG